MYAVDRTYSFETIPDICHILLNMIYKVSYGNYERSVYTYVLTFLVLVLLSYVYLRITKFIKQVL